MHVAFVVLGSALTLRKLLWLHPVAYADRIVIMAQTDISARWICCVSKMNDRNFRGGGEHIAYVRPREELRLSVNA